MLCCGMTLVVHTDTGFQGSLPISTEMAFGGFVVAGLVLAVLFYEAYRQHQEWW